MTAFKNYLLKLYFIQNLNPLEKSYTQYCAHVDRIMYIFPKCATIQNTKISNSLDILQGWKAIYFYV